MYFNRRNYKVLRYIYKHPDVNEGKLVKKYDEESDPYVSWLLIGLVQDGYIGGYREDGSYLVFNKPPFHSAESSKYRTLDKGDEYIENRHWNMYKWLVPLVFSAISLLFSFYNIFIKQ